MDAYATLGVGKNMAQSIKYWCLALGLIESDEKEHRVTNLGNYLFGPDGRDPFLERYGTLWLLHWQLTRQPMPASSWFLAFTSWSRLQFSREQLITWLFHTASHAGDRVSMNSVKRDVGVLLRTYSPTRNNTQKNMEMLIDCPLVALGLIHESEDGLFYFNRGMPQTLPVELFAYALHDYWETHKKNQKSIPFESILYAEGSPGAAFNLSENALADLLDSCSGKYGFQFDETAGMKSIFKQSKRGFTNKNEFLVDYYGKYE